MKRNAVVDLPGELRRHARYATREADKELDEARRAMSSFRKRTLDGEDAWKSLREAVKEVAHAQAYREIAAWWDEAAEAVSGATSAEADEVLLALRDRATWLLANPPVSTIHGSFADAEKLLGVTFDGVRFPTAEYGDYFHRPVDVYFFYYVYVFSPFAFMPWSVEKVIAAVRADDPHEFTEEALELVNSRHREWAERITEEELANALERMNEVILGRYEPFGTRVEVPPDSPDVTTVAWADTESGGHWVIFRNAFFGGVTYESALVERLVHGKHRRVRLDSNQVILPYPPAIVELVISSLYPLPSASSGFYAKRRARESGKRGPLVSDRVAKGIVAALAMSAEKARVVSRYGITKEQADEIVTADNHMVKGAASAAWDRLVNAKAADDRMLLREVLDELHADAVPAALGQLVNWFSSVRLEPDDPADWWKGGSRSNPDAELRDLERRYSMTGAPMDAKRLYLAARRAGVRPALLPDVEFEIVESMHDAGEITTKAEARDRHAERIGAGLLTRREELLRRTFGDRGPAAAPLMRWLEADPSGSNPNEAMEQIAELVGADRGVDAFDAQDTDGRPLYIYVAWVDWQKPTLFWDFDRDRFEFSTTNRVAERVWT